MTDTTPLTSPSTSDDREARVQELLGRLRPGAEHILRRMAERLVEGMVEEFKPNRYEDEYRRDLMKLIHKKVKAGEVNRIPEETEAKPHRPRPTNVIDLVDLLSQSLSKGPRKAKGRVSRGKPPRSDGHKKSA